VNELVVVHYPSQMHNAYETLKNILAVIGAGSVTATLAIAGFIVLAYIRERKR